MDFFRLCTCLEYCMVARRGKVASVQEGKMMCYSQRTCSIRECAAKMAAVHPSEGLRFAEKDL